MQSEPVALFAAIAIVVVSLASMFGVVLDTTTIETLLVNGVFVVTAILQRRKVSPVGS